MERRVGEIFTYKGKTYRVAESRMGCTGCAFNYTICIIHKPFLGSCSYLSRTDVTDIIFKLINNNNNMKIENNQLTIEIPEGMEIDLENSDLAKGIIKFKHKNITYDNILQAYAIDFGKLTVSNHCIDKLLAISRLMDIARYYNKDWKYDVTKEEGIGYIIVYDGSIKAPNYTIRRIEACANIYYGNVIFKNEADAKAVINNPNFRDILDDIYKN